VLGTLADAYRRCDQIEQGLEVVDSAIERVVRTGERTFEADLHRLRGELLLARDGPILEAERALELAITVARRQGATALEARAVVSLGRLWQARGTPVADGAALAAVERNVAEGLRASKLDNLREILQIAAPCSANPTVDQVTI
jgi:predicted ATPase